LRTLDPDSTHLPILSRYIPKNLAGITKLALAGSPVSAAVAFPYINRLFSSVPPPYLSTTNTKLSPCVSAKFARTIWSTQETIFCWTPVPEQQVEGERRTDVGRGGAADVEAVGAATWRAVHGKVGDGPVYDATGGRCSSFGGGVRSEDEGGDDGCCADWGEILELDSVFEGEILA
jgi:hypothetical protein